MDDAHYIDVREIAREEVVRLTVTTAGRVAPRAPPARLVDAAKPLTAPVGRDPGATRLPEATQTRRDE